MNRQTRLGCRHALLSADIAACNAMQGRGDTAG